ncbi:MAG: hypothetical protein KJ886_00700, partial [Candidatus Thermoplasmatota archaeon]|nr:hypothetical protein [Candidatus Thermoplasmatota archaeon]
CSPILTQPVHRERILTPSTDPYRGVQALGCSEIILFDVSSDSLPGTHQSLVGLPDPVASGLHHTS